MHDAEKLSLEAMGRFVEASEEIRFEAEDRRQLYGWVEQVLVGQQYAHLGKASRGLVRRYIEKMTGLGRAQGTRLIARYTATGRRGQAGQAPARHRAGLCGQSGVPSECHAAVAGSSVGRCILAAPVRLGESARGPSWVAVLARVCRICRIGIAPTFARSAHPGDAAGKIDRSHLARFDGDRSPRKAAAHAGCDNSS